jgi:outer membrane protein OmpA-like peptidoglycan-associated protein
MKRERLVKYVLILGVLLAGLPLAAIAQEKLQFSTEGVKGDTRKLDVKETDTEVKINLQADVLFDFDKADIRQEAEPTLRKAVDVIKKYPRSKVLIEGHTDGKGSDEYNQKLSERRANSVKDWFVKNGGVNSKRFETKGWGKTKPVAPNTKPDGSDDPEGRQKNRRVEMTVNKK